MKKKLFLIVIFLFSFTSLVFSMDTTSSTYQSNNPIDVQYLKVLDGIVGFQYYFTKIAGIIALIVTSLCLLWTLIKYAMTGEGLKEAIVKYVLAFIVYFVVLTNYSTIISEMSDLTYTMGTKSVWNNGFDTAFNNQLETGVHIYHPKNWTANQMQIKQVPDGNNEDAITIGDTAAPSNLQQLDEINERESMGTNYDKYVKPTTKHLTIYTGNWSINSINDIFNGVEVKTQYYHTLYPSALFTVFWLAATNAFLYAFDGNLLQVLLGLFLVVVIAITGIMGCLNYFVCFLEFMLVTGVGIMMLPFMLWDATKFLSEKLIGAVVGFFIKLLICTMCIYLMLWGFLGLATGGFNGALNQIINILFTCFLYFALCTKGPELATSLLTGSPQMNATGALSTAAGALGAAAAVIGFGASMGAKTALTATGIGGAGLAAGKAAKGAGASGFGVIKAGLTGAGGHALDTAKGAAGNLVHTLATGRPPDKRGSTLKGNWDKSMAKAAERGAKFHPSKAPNNPAT